MKRNAILFLVSGAMSSVAMGAFMTTQGLYIMCLGYGEELLGLILSGRMVAGAVGALPAGMISDRYGRKKLGASPTVVGLILSLSNGATAVAGLLAPALVPRLGRVRTVVFTQVASIPFLLMIAVPPWLWLVGTAMFFRNALMNMSSPVAASFSMEIMEPQLRGTTSSLMRIADSLARAASSLCAGWIMARWGYDLPYVFTAALYLAASLLYYRRFREYDARDTR